MAKYLTHFGANALLDQIFRGVTAPIPDTVEVRLYTVAPTAAGGGTEVVGGSYTAQPLTMSTAASSATSNTVSLLFTGMPACTVVAAAVHDADTGDMWWVNDGLSIVCASGSNKTVPVGDLDASFASVA